MSFTFRCECTNPSHRSLCLHAKVRGEKLAEPWRRYCWRCIDNCAAFHASRERNIREHGR